ncbi:hypothetical protein [Urbifossiella limnaea]|uniref:Lipoprotein n=1 Tax=Urbifossiella limnaea TaxID=2528023 RepID=A0A517XKZ4_9BACT|nr:hypothetical protein [Urbifossiella limnaea]QDU18170.1 hypothetical protein ETAA1_00530 [Urbifossiella limnaea]
MKRLIVAFVLAAVCGCGGGDKELPTTTDPDAIKREQERLRGGPGVPAAKQKAAK